MKTEQRARKLLRDAGVETPPIPVEAIAAHLGVPVKYQAYTGKLSGMLARRGDDWVIGVNSLHAPVRQRFTIAHEIGHLKLHASTRDVFVDESFAARFDRGPKSATGTDQQEIEANRFAAELLMPREFLRKDLIEILEDDEFDSWDAEKFITDLARRYRVSVQAMTIRLTVLGLGRAFGIDANPR